MQEKGILYFGEETEKECPLICEIFQHLGCTHYVKPMTSMDGKKSSTSSFDYAILVLTKLDEEAVKTYFLLEESYSIQTFFIVHLCQKQMKQSYRFVYIGEGDTLLMLDTNHFDPQQLKNLLNTYFYNMSDESNIMVRRLLEKGFLQSVLLNEDVKELKKYMTAFQFEVKNIGCLCMTAVQTTMIKRKQIRWFIAEQFTCMTFGYVREESCYLFILAKEEISVAQAYDIAAFIHTLDLDENNLGISSIKSSLENIHDAFMESHENYLQKSNQGRNVKMFHIQQCEEELQDIIVDVGHDLFLNDLDGIKNNVDKFVQLLLGISSVNRIDVVRYFLKTLAEEMVYLKGANTDKVRQILMLESEKIQFSEELNSISISLMYLLKLIMKLISRSEEPQQHEILLKVYDYIWKNYSKSIGLNEVAEYLDVTPQYICMLFTKYTNTKFSKLLNFNRIKQAKKLLRSLKKVKEVAILCGYHNVSYFEKKFKSTTGYTPREYQDIFQQPHS